MSIRDAWSRLPGAALSLGSACCLAACSAWSGTLVRLDTASPDVAAYAERYNLAQDRYRVITRYVSGPAESLARGGSDADVLIGPGLAGGDLARRVLSLDRLFRPGLLDASAFFPDLLRSGRARGAQRALPLSYRLPVVVVRARDGDVPPFAVTPDELAERDAAALGWDAELVYRTAIFYGADFRLLPDGRIGFQPGAVDRAVELARRLTAAAGDPFASPLLDGAPRTRPLLEMLLDGRIDFFVTDLQGFLDIPGDRRGLFGFRWLGREDRLQPSDDVTYAAIRAGARNARGAQAFLLWLFDPATQAALLDLSRRQHLTGFGIAGGLPALTEVAAHEMPARHPFMVGRVPDTAELTAPAALGADWGALRDAVVLPWLRAAVRGAEQPPLAQAIDDWRQRRLGTVSADRSTLRTPVEDPPRRRVDTDAQGRYVAPTTRLPGMVSMLGPGEGEHGYR